MTSGPSTATTASTAAQRTLALAEDNTVLANERTYTAWVRTGLAALAAGVAFEQFLTTAMPDWAIRGIALILIVFSACAFVLAVWRYARVGMRLKEADVATLHVATLILLGAALVACSALALVGLVLVG